MDRFVEEGIRYYSKYIGVVQISDPTTVQTRLTSELAGEYSSGMVYCSCPEMGFEGDNLIPCRYGLSLPYYKVKDGDRLWIESTIGQTERWMYSGFVDCGREAVDPTAIVNTQGIIQNDDGTFTFTMGAMSIVLDSTAKTITVDTAGDGKAKVTLDAENQQIEITDGVNIVTTDGTVPSIQITDGTNIIDLNASGIKLTTTDAAAWKPNILAVDPFSGVPHGGPGAGIVKLTGG